MIRSRLVPPASLLLTMLALPACGGAKRGAAAPTAGTPPESVASAVALVDGEPISAEEVKRQAEATGSDTRAALDALVESRLLVREAERRGLAADTPVSASVGEAVSEAVKREMVRRFLALGFEREVTAASAVGDDDLRRVYAKNGNQLDHPELRRVLHVFAPALPSDDPHRRETALQRAQQVAARARTVHDVEGFKALAAQLSDDQVHLRGEDLVTGRVGWTLRPFAEAAFALPDVGSVSGVVETNLGYHVLYLEEKIPAVHVPMEQVREKLRAGIWPEVRRRAFARMVDSLVEKHRVQVWPERLVDEAGPDTSEPGGAAGQPAEAAR